LSIATNLEGVHGYLGIDPEKVYAALPRSARDFTDFEAEILAWLDRRV